MRSAACAATLALLALASAAAGREAEPLADDPALERRVMQIAEEMRCLVCQNETLADSQADLAVDLRRQIRERLRRGDSPGQVGDFLVARYGEFVRYRPALSPTTAVLWGGPFALLAAGVTVLATQLRRVRALRVAPLSDDEQRRLAALRHAAGSPR